MSEIYVIFSWIIGRACIVQLTIFLQIMQLLSLACRLHLQKLAQKEINNLDQKRTWSEVNGTAIVGDKLQSPDNNGSTKYQACCLANEMMFKGKVKLVSMQYRVYFEREY